VQVAWVNRCRCRSEAHTATFMAAGFERPTMSMMAFEVDSEAGDAFRNAGLQELGFAPRMRVADMGVRRSCARCDRCYTVIVGPVSRGRCAMGATPFQGTQGKLLPSIAESRAWPESYSGSGSWRSS